MSELLLWNWCMGAVWCLALVWYCEKNNEHENFYPYWFRLVGLTAFISILTNFLAK